MFGCKSNTIEFGGKESEIKASEYMIEGQQKASATQVAGQHYRELAIQPAYFCYVNNIPYLEATAIKYLCRHRLKNKKEDLLKAKHFIDLLIEFEYDKE